MTPLIQVFTALHSQIDKDMGSAYLWTSIKNCLVTHARERVRAIEGDLARRA